MSRKFSPKRKVIDLVESDNEDEPVSTHITNMETALNELKEFVQRPEQASYVVEGKMVDFSKTFIALLKKLDENYNLKSFDRSLEAIARAGKVEEDRSDDEESVVDESDTWMVMCRQLRDYRIVNGDCNVPQKFKDNPALGRWVSRQRFAYNNPNKRNGGKITSEKIDKLERLGFCWGKNHPPPTTWDEMFERLKNYKQNMGDCNVPHNDKHPSALAKWLASQRSEHRRFKQGRDHLITPKQINSLNEIGMNWKGSKS